MLRQVLSQGDKAFSPISEEVTLNRNQVSAGEIYRGGLTYLISLALYIYVRKDNHLKHGFTILSAWGKQKWKKIQPPEKKFKQKYINISKFFQ